MTPQSSATPLDPNLVAGFAAEARSHLPEIHRILADGPGEPDAQALSMVHQHLASMRDASSMVGLEPLGRALALFTEKLEAGASPLGEPLRLLEEYLENLEASRDGLAEPSVLLDELELIEASSTGPAEADSGGDSEEPALGGPGISSEGSDLPLPSWVSGSAPPAPSRQTPRPAQPSKPAAKPCKSRDDGPSAAVREIFAAEADEHGQAVSRRLGELREGRFTREPIESLRRRVHNLKGSAALVKRQDLSRVAHGMEDVFDVLFDERRGPSGPELAALELAGDALQALIYRGGRGVSVDEVLRTLASSGSPASDSSDASDAASADELSFDSVLSSEPDSSAPTVSAPARRPARISPAPQTELAAEAADRDDPLDASPAEASSPQVDSDQDRFVRVSVQALDEAMRLLVEVDAERHYLRQLVTGQKDHALELELADRRLQRDVHALESGLEIAALGTGAVRSSGRAAETAFDALEMDRYSELHERSRSLVESTGDLETVNADLGRQLVSMEHSVERLEGSTVRLRDRLIGLRLVSLGSLAPRLEGVVRLAARATDKEARLIFDDGGVELDKDVLDALVDPLDHLLRNAVAHGLETLPERAEAGKPARGIIRISARYGLEGVELTLTDDGRGIDVDTVAARAVERGLLQPSALDELEPSQVRELIFEPGLSTAAKVDQVSGRGVGMDVVRQRLGELRGVITIEQSDSGGTTFRLELPTTLAVQRVLMVEDGGHRLALPGQGIERMERMDPARVESIGDREILRSGDEAFQVVRLAEATGLEDAALEGAAARPENNPVAIFARVADRPTAFVVDAVLGGREVVVQDLGRHLGRLPGLLGVTQADVGHPVPILDPAAWLERTAKTRAARRPRATTRQLDRRSVLVVDDSLSMRRYLRQLVERLGYMGVEARDGLDAVEMLDGGVINPSLILLDLEMPRMDGFELMSTLRADTRFSETPRVVLTSRDASKHRRRATHEGADEYLVKPVGEKELEATLKRWIGRSREP